MLDTSLIKRESDFFHIIFKLGLMPEDQISQRTQLKLFENVEPEAKLKEIKERLSMHQELRQGKPLSIQIS